MDKIALKQLVKDLSIWRDEHNRKLDSRVHQAYGWEKFEEMDDASQFTPGATFSVGSDCWMAPMVYYFPPDLKEQYTEMILDEGGILPEEYDEPEAKEWWMGDSREDQYPLNYTTNIDHACYAIPAYQRVVTIAEALAWGTQRSYFGSPNWREYFARAITICNIKRMIGEIDDGQS